MDFSLLGPLDVRADGRSVPLGGMKPRALVAVLLLHPNEPVSAERLAQALWGEDAPPSALKTVQVYVSRLRRALGDADVLSTTGAGYRLRVRGGELDATRFARLVSDGRRALAAGDGESAAASLDGALAMWRGPPLAEFVSLPFAAAEMERFEEQRLAAIELRVEADLELGRHHEVVADLRRLTAAHPWRERLHAQLMLALYRSGRQADALEAYRLAREVLVEELGIDPGDDLADLHRAILAHDPGLGAAPQRRSGLPAPPNPTIGREEELTAIAQRLRAGSVRLLSLVGPGGVGKTRLALEAARAVQDAFSDGAALVRLAPLKRPQDVAGAVLAALGIVPVSSESPEEAAVRFLAAKHLLLVLDNFEHVLEAAPLVGALLEACSGVTVLATSREPLSLRAEQRHAVPPLGRAAAVTLFNDRARGHDLQFELNDDNAAAVEDVCRRVDGLPLAIELAAARCALLSPRELAARLDAALAELGGGARDAPDRQRTLRATIDWSYELLDDDEKTCFARFAVFAGGATVDAAEAVLGADLRTLDRLVSKSLLVRRTQADGQSRLFMLETVRAFAAERLGAAPDRETVRERHCRHFLAYAQRHGDRRALSRADRGAHVACLDSEIDNLRAALGWSVARADPGSALALTAALVWYWMTRNRYAEGNHWIDQALALPGTEAHTASLVGTLRGQVWMLWPVGRRQDQAAGVARAQAVAREAGDPLMIAQALVMATDFASVMNRPELAFKLADEALAWAKRTGDPWETASALRALARGVTSTPDLRECVARAAPALERVGNLMELADLLTSAAYTALCEGDDELATELVERASPVTRATGDRFMWLVLTGNRGLAALFTGDHGTARAAFREELETVRDLVLRPMASEGFLGLAGIAAAEGDVVRAARLSGAVQSHRDDDQQDDIVRRIEAGFLDAARERAGPDAWQRSVREGAALSFERAVAYALEDTPARLVAGR